MACEVDMAKIKVMLIVMLAVLVACNSSNQEVRETSNQYLIVVTRTPCGE